ncbi:hypothetical protein [Dictyobacter kobayashii]|uniref:Uncharacterized protein n=1 Tax=Dictyobacter kobayashii TaxID=2014872 RepID=A0A402ARL5_9CHLR|nr:hypothetical protein [Dictyobacter kobayashii]GCE21738.1 hypothetical protein KDK_55380 [Dictyobacter kobayashii]
MLHVSYEDLLRLAASYKYAGIFHADIIINGKPGFVEILIQDGKPFDILSVPSPRPGERWVTMLAPLGQLHWKLIAPETSNIAARNEYRAMLQSNLASSQAQLTIQQPKPHIDPIPRQKIQLQPDQIRQLPHRYRVVYLLIDGYRSPQEIATLLNKSLEETTQTLDILHQQGLIA